MSIEEKSVAAVSAEEKPMARPVSERWKKVLRSPLWLCLLAALLIRIWLLYHTHGVIDGDEATVGIQAEHILRGEHPYYYYAQAYMGSLEAYLMALLFAIAGPSVVMLRGEPMLLSLVVVWLTWRLAGALADAAQLPPFAQQTFKTVAALLAAIAPLYDTVLEMRTLGGYVETFVVMLLLLLSAFALTRRWRAGAASKELAWRWAAIGFIVGFGFWINPLIVIAILAAAIWIIVCCIAELVRLSGESAAEGRTPFTFLKGFLLAPAALPACLVGLAPALRWGSVYHWANFTYALQQGNISSLNPLLKPYYSSRLALIHDQIYFYEKYAAPRVIGGALPKESAMLFTIHSFTFYAGLFCILAASILFVLSLLWRSPLLLGIRQLVALPLLFAICAAITFCTSISSSTGLISFQNDIAGRYATPLMLVLPFFFATVFLLANMSIYKLSRRYPFQIEERKRNSSRPRLVVFFSRLYIPLVAQALLCAFLLAYLGAQVSTYALTDADATFQSPSCPIAPADNDPIIAYLQHKHVQYAWAITWIGYPISFKTDEGIITSDPRNIIIYHGLDRVPGYTEAVLHADRPAMLTIVKHDDRYPVLLKTLDALHVTYKEMRFWSEPGYDVLVVTALSRTVSLLESKAFISAFPGCL